MVHTCAIHGCHNRGSGQDKRSFYRIPTVRQHEGQQTMELSQRRRDTWIARINRKDFIPSAYTKVCSDHFITGKPGALYDTTHPDWAPSVKLVGESLTKPSSSKPVSSTNMSRYERTVGRRAQRNKHMAAEALIDLWKSPVNQVEDVTQEQSVDEQTNHQSEECSQIQTVENSSNPDQDSAADSCTVSMCIKTRTECQRLTTENMDLKQVLEDSKITEDSFKNSEKKVRYYTGLPSFVTLMAVFKIIEPYIPDSNRISLTKFQKVIMVLMKLRLNIPVQDLAYRFQVSTATVSRTFLCVIHVMFVRLNRLIFWPEREELRLSMPMEFRKHFGVKVAVIIDCFEIFIERPSNLLARAKTWSSYKHHNTVKFLIGITPQGSISFLSKAWGGRASDKYITEHSGLLQKLNPGDIVLADRGFDIKESVGLMCAEVKIPSFTKGRAQLPALEVESTRKIAHVRIHVERVIGLTRNKYTILSGTLPLDYFSSAEGEVPTVDKIVTVCCCLTNLCESVVPFN